MIFTFDFKEAKDKFNSWWTKEKNEAPVESTVGVSVVGCTTATAGALCISNGLKRLASGENTYGGVGPILTIIAGLGFSVTGIRSLSEAIKLYKKIKPKKTENSDKEEKKE